jgi:chorismate mutase
MNKLHVMNSSNLEVLRKSIDNIDAALLHLLAERFSLTGRVGLLKKREGLPAEDSSREKEQIARYRSIAGSAGLDPEIALRLHSFLVEESKKNHRIIKEDSSIG